MKKLQLLVALFLAAGITNVFASENKKAVREVLPQTAQQRRQARAENADHSGRYADAKIVKAKDIRKEQYRNPKIN